MKSVSGAAGRGVERECHRPGHLDRRGERCRRVDEHVVASLDRPPIPRAAVIEEQDRAAYRRDRIVRIVDVSVGRLVARRRSGNDTIAGEGVGPAAAVQVVAGVFGAGERPLVLVAPDVRTHHEEPDRRLVVNPVLHTLQSPVVPAQVLRGDVHGRLAAKADGPERLCRADILVAPGADQQLGLRPRRGQNGRAGDQPL